MLIRRHPPRSDKRARSQLMEHQLIVLHVALLVFQRRHPAATENRPDRDHNTHTSPPSAPQKFKAPESLGPTPGRTEHPHDFPHNRRRLLGSTGLTG